MWAGLWIDGAGWDKKRVSLVDQAPKVLFYELPVLWITGVQHTEKKSGWGFAATPGGKIDMTKYSCPLYMYPRRCTGALGTYIDQIVEQQIARARRIDVLWKHPLQGWARRMHNDAPQTTNFANNLNHKARLTRQVR